MIHVCLILHVHGIACAGALKLSDALLSRKYLHILQCHCYWYMVVDQSASVLELVHSSQSPAIFMAAFVLAL